MIEAILNLTSNRETIEAVLPRQSTVAVNIDILEEAEVGAVEHVLIVVIGAEDEVQRPRKIARNPQILRDLLRSIRVGNLEHLERGAICILWNEQLSFVPAADRRQGQCVTKIDVASQCQGVGPISTALDVVRLDLAAAETGSEVVVEAEKRVHTGADPVGPRLSENAVSIWI